MGYDVCVIGGGHAGCEAALAAARMGMKTVLFAINLDSIAMMPCNPNIGGTSKGHIVREIDALGGEMGKNIDKTFIQSRMLNTSKGPAVYSLRAQADKKRYSNEMKKTLERTEHLEIRQSEIVDIVVEDGEVRGVLTESGIKVDCTAAVLCTGTYLKARCLYGETIVQSGPNGLRASTVLSESLEKLGIRMFRFKTGTPARIDKKSVDFSKMRIQNGDEEIVPFSFETDPDKIKREQVPCHLTYTNSTTHSIIKDNLNRSPLYMGVIEGTGTRYCPSIEDKVVRFPDKESHQVFIEPEGEDTDEMYVQGMSTSLPESVQVDMYRSISGLENCRIMRPGYAIEYDCIDATQLRLSLEFKDIKGLFSAGQFNGSSGYEEAAGQGIIAGINAALSVKGRQPLILTRADGYIGVLIDDLVTKGSNEPYRMMTSRAEYRLLLRQDNADLRLLEKGYEAGLVPENRYKRFSQKKAAIEREIKRVSKTVITPTEELNTFLTERGSTQINTGVKLIDLIKRPELDYKSLMRFDPEHDAGLDAQVVEQISISIKYEGYIKLQIEQIERMKKIESKIIPKDFDYSQIKSLSSEARQKLERIRPENVGQAGRIAGVSPADVSMLLIYLRDIH